MDEARHGEVADREPTIYAAGLGHGKGMSPTRIITVSWFMAITPALEAGGLTGAACSAGTGMPRPTILLPSRGRSRHGGKTMELTVQKAFAGAFAAYRQQACLEGVCEFVPYTTKVVK